MVYSAINPGQFNIQKETKLTKMKKIITILFTASIFWSAAQCPDLKITAGSILLLKSNRIKYTINLTNIGNKTANLTGNFSTDLDNVLYYAYLSEDNSISSNDKLLQVAALGVSPLEELKPDEIFSITQQDSIQMQGYNYLIIQIDPTGLLNECSESNNQYVIKLNQNKLKLSIPDLEGPKGSSLEIPVYGADFNNILGFQFSISTSENKILRIDSIGKPGLDEWNKNDIRIYNQNKIAAIWFSPFTEGYSFEGTRKLFSIFVTLTGDPGECANLFFTDAILPIEFISSHPLSDPIVPELDHGKICIQKLVECSGKITLSNLIPLPKVNVKANQYSSVTDFQGNYKFSELAPAQTYTVSATKNDLYATGLSVIDILLIKRHLLQIQSLSTPYELIAADVNGDLTVSVQDIVLIRSLILGLVPDFGKTPVWQFIPKEYKFKNPQNPFKEDYPIAYTLNNLTTNKINVDFIGLKTGDVSLDAIQGLNILEDRSTNPYWLESELSEFEPDRIQTINFNLKNTADLIGLQMSINKNPGVNIVQIKSASLPGFGTQNYSIKDDQIRIVWDGLEENGKIKNENLVISISFTTDKKIKANQLFTLDDQDMTSFVVNNQFKSIGISALPYQVKNIPAQNSKEIKLSLFPVPSKGTINLTIDAPLPVNARILLVDLSGRQLKVFNQPLVKGAQVLTIDLSSIPEGTYRVIVSAEAYMVTGKILLIK